MAGLLGAAIGGPYVVSQAPDWTEGWNPNGAPGPAPVTHHVDPNLLKAPNANAPEGPGSEIYRRPAPFEGRVQRSLDEILRWEITKDWVFRSWDRKSTGLADPELFGVRVPVVTGQGMADVAGALSYYFDAQGVLQRIRLVGTTADTNGIARIATLRFGMQRRVGASPGDQLYQAEENKQVRSQLRTRPEPVLWGTSPHNSFRVELEANRPGSAYWVRTSLPELAPPSTTASPSSHAAAATPTPGEEQPVFPPRAVVPDEAGAAGASDAIAPQTASGEPKPPSVVKPEADIAPLDSYRERFRWPN